jgi:hypothetical protein
LAVGDLGVGVRSSLEVTNDLTGMTDSEVLGHATRPGVTGSPGGGGMGLSTIVDAIRQNGRAVHLASAHGTYSVRKTYDSGGETAVEIPGTIVEVAFDRPES